MSPSDRPVVTFLSDFGLDGAAAICRGVILAICPEAQIVDIAHTVPKYAIADAAFILASALPWMPVGVHLAVVDPGVGTARHPIAVRVARGDILVGPDNGLLIDGADALGGISEVRELANEALWGPARSSTFHGRDLFAPVAARLAANPATFDDLGPVLPAADLVRLARRTAAFRDGWLETEVIYVDSFGNLRLAGSASDLARLGWGEVGAIPLQVELPAETAGEPRVIESHLVTTFGEVAEGSSLVYLDSSGHPALADSQGNAAARLAVRTGVRVRVRQR